MGIGNSKKIEGLDHIPADKETINNFCTEIEKLTSSYKKHERFMIFDDLDQWKIDIESFIQTCVPLKSYLHSMLNLHVDLEEAKTNNSEWYHDFQKSVHNYKRYHRDTRTKHTVVVPQKQHEEEEIPRKVLQSEIENLHEKNNYMSKQLDDQHDKIAKLMKEKSEFAQRLSEEWNAKVGADERNIENVNIKNRPMNVATEYEFLNSNYWLDAKGNLDDEFKGNPEAEKLKLLCQLPMVAHKFATDKYDEMASNIYTMISVHAEKGGASSKAVKYGIKENITGSTPRQPKEEMKKVCEAMPLSVKNAIGDFLRTTSDSADITAISEGIVSELQEKLRKLSSSAITDIKKYEKLVKYADACGRLAWKMVAQRPQMHFDDSKGVGAKWKGEKEQELYYRSEDPNKPCNVIIYYVHPNLLHEKATMVKGKVFVGPKT